VTPRLSLADISAASNSHPNDIIVADVTARHLLAINRWSWCGIENDACDARNSHCGVAIL